MKRISLKGIVRQPNTEKVTTMEEGSKVKRISLKGTVAQSNTEKVTTMEEEFR